MIALTIQSNAIEALARGDVEQIFIGPAAKADIRGNLGLEISNFFPCGRIDIDARTIFGTPCDVEVSLPVAHQSVRAVLRSIIDEQFAEGRRAVLVQVVSQQR